MFYTGHVLRKSVILNQNANLRSQFTLFGVHVNSWGFPLKVKRSELLNIQVFTDVYEFLKSTRVFFEAWAKAGFTFTTKNCSFKEQAKF